MSHNTTVTASRKNASQQAGSAPNACSGSNTIPSWCIFVKTVGKGFDECQGNDDGANSSKHNKISSVDGSFSFHVTVSPEDRIDFLHDEIEGVTGVKASQQRLIYRGRLIGKSDIAPISRNSTTDDNENSSIEQSSPSSKEKSDRNVTTNCEKELQQEYKIKDIVGLCDGQTIHLVKKRDCGKENANSTDAVNEQGNSIESRNNENDSVVSNVETEYGGGSGALLAALLGLETRLAEDGGNPARGSVASGTRSNAASNINRSSGQVATSNSNQTVTSPWRSSRSNNDSDTTTGSSLRQTRRPHYRLGSEDLEVPDPGSLEPVRQGLMTLNTIMNSQPHPRGEQDVDRGRRSQHPLEVNREWFRGQWIDARDTVNQWLEATVVDILDPQDVLNDTVEFRDPTATAVHERRYGCTENQQPRQRIVPNVDNDPAISANDLEGRRRLLLEECEPGDPNEIIIDADNETDQTSPRLHEAQGTRLSQSFRPRSSNNGVKLLLIHYNGWPHRWDEWIRSDSERLRPFRTRTRHPNTSSMASPTPQSHFSEAPRTNIIEDGLEDDDRFAVLPELSNALSRVNELLSDLVQREQRNQSKDYGEDELEDLHPSNIKTNDSANLGYKRARADLPWRSQKSDAHNENCVRRQDNNSPDGASRTQRLPTFDEANGENHEINHAVTEGAPTSEDNKQSGESGSNCDVRAMYNGRELRNLATLFDRLGRTLTDVAPHVASIAASISTQEETNAPASECQDAPTATESTSSFGYETSTAPLGGLLSLWSRERDRTRRNTMDRENTTIGPTTAAAPVDPDHIDFASGIVNITRGEVRSGPRYRTSHQDDVAGLLGTYLAAASLGSTGNSNGESGSGATSSLARLFQRGSGGGSGDNGIDIHIHAIVTAPGASPGGMGIATLSSGGTSPTVPLGGARNILSSTRNSSRSDGGILRSGTSSPPFVEPTDEEDYSDLFSELYSESPTPIDPNASPVREADSVQRTSNNGNTDDDNHENNCATATLSGSFDRIESPSDTISVTSSRNRNRSAPRRQNRPRVFRLFRRRGSRSNNQDESNNEDS